MRHENGNCLPMGGFCTAVNDEICAGLRNAYNHGELVRCRDCQYYQNNAEQNHDAPELLKELKKTVPEELDLKMWHALFAEEDRCRKHFAKTENNDLLFGHWLPWLRKGFGIAMTAIAEWEEGKADA